MKKSTILKKLAHSIEWNWMLVRCYKGAIHILWSKKVLKKTSLVEQLTHRMEENRMRAKELQSIYNVLYFNRY